MQKPNIPSVIKAALFFLCGIAGTVATYAPDGGVQQAAQTVAQQCETNGIPAFPVLEVPRQAEDAGTPSPTPPRPALELPAPPFTQGERAELRHDGGAYALAAASHQVLLSGSSWTWLPAAEVWPGEARGWL